MLAWLALFLSWGSLGLETATVVVSIIATAVKEASKQSWGDGGHWAVFSMAARACQASCQGSQTQLLSRCVLLSACEAERACSPLGAMDTVSDAAREPGLSPTVGNGGQRQMTVV